MVPLLSLDFRPVPPPAWWTPARLAFAGGLILGTGLGLLLAWVLA